VTIDIDAEFADLDKYYPGSRRTRRTVAPTETRTKDESAWDARPIIKRYNGEDTEFFMLNALASALGKSVRTLRFWERKGYIPKAPFRLPEQDKHGNETPGKRVYTRSLIEVTVEEFSRRGLLGAARVEWTHHSDLTIALYEQWNRLITD
jgi:hypothetical protein